MAAENKHTTFSNLDKNETDPDLIVKAATNFLFENARKHVKEYLEKDDDFNKLHERSKQLVVKYFVMKNVDVIMEKFKEEMKKN